MWSRQQVAQVHVDFGQDDNEQMQGYLEWADSRAPQHTVGSAPSNSFCGSSDQGQYSGSLHVSGGDDSAQVSFGTDLSTTNRYPFRTAPNVPGPSYSPHFSPPRHDPFANAMVPVEKRLSASEDPTLESVTASRYRYEEHLDTKECSGRHASAAPPCLRSKSLNTRQTSTEKKAFCPACGVTFTRTWDLKLHIENTCKGLAKHQGKFKCTFCDESLIQKENYADHLNGHFNKKRKEAGTYYVNLRLKCFMSCPLFMHALTLAYKKAHQPAPALWQSPEWAITQDNFIHIEKAFFAFAKPEHDNVVFDKDELIRRIETLLIPTRLQSERSS